MNFEKVTIIGAGAWGMAIALHLHRENRSRVALYSVRNASRNNLRESRSNAGLLEGVSLPEGIQIPETIQEAMANAGLVISCVPSAHLRKIFEEIKPGFPRNLPVISTTKGMERGTFFRPSQVILDVLGSGQVAVLSGPSHAEEVVRGMPTSVVVAGEDGALNKQVQTLFNSESFRVYTNNDPVGVEIAGALKNVIAIAAGINDGLGFGDNAKAALITRGIVEIARFGVSLGAQMKTFYGLAGLGDLIATCASRHSRNRMVGERLGKGERLEDFLPRMNQVAEGVVTAPTIREQAIKTGLDMPIMEQVYQVLAEGKSPKSAVLDLMQRVPRDESCSPKG